MYIYIYIYIFACYRVFLFIYASVYMHTSVCMYKCVYICTHTYMYKCVYVQVCVSCRHAVKNLVHVVAAVVEGSVEVVKSNVLHSMEYAMCMYKCVYVQVCVCTSVCKLSTRRRESCTRCRSGRRKICGICLDG